MVLKKTLADHIFDTFNTIILTLISVICLYPLLYVLFASLSEPDRLIQHMGMLVAPLGFTLEGYRLVLKNPDISSGYANTLFYVIAGTALNMLMTALGAYVLSRKRLLWKKTMMLLIVITMYFQGGLIPSYLLVKNLGLLDNRLALIIPSAITTWNLLVLRTAFRSIPDSLEESAKIDGANDFTILIRIIIPLSKASLSVIALYYIVAHWNSWFNAMIYLRKRQLFPLQLILREILLSNDTSSTTSDMILDHIEGAEYRLLVQYCTIIVATAPILAAYPFIQKYFVKGVMLGSLKG